MPREVFVKHHHVQTVVHLKALGGLGELLAFGWIEQWSLEEVRHGHDENKQKNERETRQSLKTPPQDSQLPCHQELG